MPLRLIIAAACLCVLLPCPAQGQQAPSSTDEMFASKGSETPGLSVLVARGGKVLFERFGGGADIEQHTAVTPRTRFHVASVSKQFTAAAVLLLVREGKLRLDDRARHYLPSLPEGYAAVSIRQLLNHTGGLRDQWDLALASGASISDLLRQDRLLALIQAQKSLNFTPGSEFRYSNSGYLVAAEIVARVSGMPFARFVQERILQPLEMNDSLVYDDATLPIAHRAQSYSIDGNGGVRLSRLNFSNYGATSLFTTADDLYLWSRELLHPRLLGPSVAKEMEQTTRLTDGTVSPYGLGLNHLTVRGHDAITHTGSDAGFRALIAIYPREDATIVILSNGSDDVSALHEALVDTFLSDRVGVNRIASPPASRLARFTGYYASSWGPGFELRMEADKLVRRINGEAPRSATFHADGTIRFSGPAMRLKPSGLDQMKDNPVIGPPLTYRRVERTTPTPAMLEAAVGRYRSDELDTTISVTLDQGRLLMSNQRDPAPSPLTPVGGGAFDTSDARIQFEAGKRDKLGSLLMTMGRSRNLRFVREP